MTNAAVADARGPGVLTDDLVLCVAFAYPESLVRVPRVARSAFRPALPPRPLQAELDTRVSPTAATTAMRSTATRGGSKSSDRSPARRLHNRSDVEGPSRHSGSRRRAVAHTGRHDTSTLGRPNTRAAAKGGLADETVAALATRQTRNSRRRQPSTARSRRVEDAVKPQLRPQSPPSVRIGFRQGSQRKAEQPAWLTPRIYSQDQRSATAMSLAGPPRFTATAVCCQRACVRSWPGSGARGSRHERRIARRENLSDLRVQLLPIGAVVSLGVEGARLERHRHRDRNSLRREV
jgi:hypothetical protein